MFEPGDGFPVLRGKAAEIRHFAGPLLLAFEQRVGDTILQRKQMRAVLTMAKRIETILDNHLADYRFPDDIAREFQDCIKKFVLLNAALGHHFHPLHKRLFHFTIKMHYMMHLGMVGRFANPRLAWCYSGEAMMKRIKTIVQSSQRGGAPHVVIRKTMRKYCCGLSFEVSQ